MKEFALAEIKKIDKNRISLLEFKENKDKREQKVKKRHKKKTYAL